MLASMYYDTLKHQPTVYTYEVFDKDHKPPKQFLEAYVGLSNLLSRNHNAHRYYGGYTHFKIINVDDLKDMIKRWDKHQREWHFIAAKYNGEYVGVLLLDISEDLGRYYHVNIKKIKILAIHELCIEAKHRGKGIGSALLKYADDIYSTRRDIKAATISVAGGNSVAYNLYTSKGFTLHSCAMVFGTELADPSKLQCSMPVLVDYKDKEVQQLIAKRYENDPDAIEDCNQRATKDLIRFYKFSDNTYAMGMFDESEHTKAKTFYVWLLSHYSKNEASMLRSQIHRIKHIAIEENCKQVWMMGIEANDYPAYQATGIPFYVSMHLHKTK